MKKTGKKREEPAAGRPVQGLRMKELTEATGLPKSAILHYMAQGLLPEPVKTGRNMAYYDPSCVERVNFIKAMQSRYSFPLNKIKALLFSRDQGRDVTPLIRLSETIFGSGDGPSFDMTAFCAATGLDAQQVESLLENGLLLPLDEGSFNQYDVTIGKLYAQGFAIGVHVSDLMFYGKAAQQIVDKEMQLRKRLTAHLPEEQDAELTKRLVESARAVRNYVIDRSFQQRVASAQDLKDEALTS